MRKNIIFVLLMFLVIGIVSPICAKMVKTKNGRKIILKDDGTWVYFDKMNPTDAKVIDSDISGKYIGETKNGFAHGYGKSMGIDTYIGYFHKGKPHGKGKYIWGQEKWKGDIYIGDWKHGQRTGEGKYISDKYDYTYEGDFYKGAQHGYGKMIYANGDVYIGNWKNNKRKGKGKLIVGDSNLVEGKQGTKLVFEGKFSRYKDNPQNSLNGPGKIIVFTNGKKYTYEGNFSGNTPTNSMEFAMFLIKIENDTSNNDSSKKQEYNSNLIAKYSGNGMKTTRPFKTDGSWEVQWDASGQVFQIYLYDKSGEMVGILANQQGSGTGSSYQPKEGEYYLKVNAMGSWNIKIVNID